MIVRINEFDPANAEPYSGWGVDPFRGAIQFDWPAQTHAFEILILENDEQRQHLPIAFRQEQLRRLVPEVVEALRTSGEKIVVRLDGPLLGGELLESMRYLSDDKGIGRFAITGAARFNANESPTMSSIRIELLPQRFAELCMDTKLGLHRETRLRVLVVPDALVNPLLDVSDLDDERWGDILPQSAFVLESVRTMQSIQLMTVRFGRDDARRRITERLSAGHFDASKSTSHP